MQVLVPVTPPLTGMSSRHLLLHRWHLHLQPLQVFDLKEPSGSPYLAGDPYLLECFSPPEFISRACSIKQITSGAVFLIICGDLVLRIDFIMLVQ